MVKSVASASGGPSGHSIDRAARRRFRRSISLSLMTIAVPGSAQLGWGNKRVGRIALRIWGAVVFWLLLIGFIFLVRRPLALQLMTNPMLLWLGRWFLVFCAIGWVLLIVDAWRIGRPLELVRRHRLISTGLNLSLAIAVAWVLLFTSHLVSVQNSFIRTVFAAGETSEPHDGRYNILLLGADSGANRVGLRPDSINVASVDARSGQIVLIGLPRNLENVPFPQGSVMAREFPSGFNCDGCMLNAVATWAEDHSDRFDSDQPGISATMDAVEQITGLKLNYYALVNMAGFSQLIDAVGGVELHVHERTAIGSVGEPIQGYIELGQQTLDGETALWYVRSRVENDDWSRMGRQKCVIHAMTRTLDPQTILANASEIAESGSNMMSTDIPAGDLNVLLDLALKSRTHPMSTVSMVPPVVDTSNPDYRHIRQLVAEAITRAESDEFNQALVTSRLPTLKTSTSGTGSAPQTNQAENLDQAC